MKISTVRASIRLETTKCEHHFSISTVLNRSEFHIFEKNKTRNTMLIAFYYNNQMCLFLVVKLTHMLIAEMKRHLLFLVLALAQAYYCYIGATSVGSCMFMNPQFFVLKKLI